MRGIPGHTHIQVECCSELVTEGLDVPEKQRTREFPGLRVLIAPIPGVWRRVQPRHRAARPADAVADELEVLPQSLEAHDEVHRQPAVRSDEDVELRPRHVPVVVPAA